MEPEELVGSWVPYRGRVVDEDIAVLVDVDVDFEETLRKLQEDDMVSTYGYTITPGGPYDLLAFGKGHYRLVRREEYGKHPAIRT